MLRQLNPSFKYNKYSTKIFKGLVEYSIKTIVIKKVHG